MVYDFGSVRKVPRFSGSRWVDLGQKNDRSQKQTAAQIPRPTEILQGPVGRSQVASEAWKMHVNFFYPGIVALECELIDINKNKPVLDRILAVIDRAYALRLFLAQDPLGRVEMDEVAPRAPRQRCLALRCPASKSVDRVPKARMRAILASMCR
jgi:hypothetical protein